MQVAGIIADSMLRSRQSSQTSAGVWHRAQPPQRPEAHDGGALASEAGYMWESCGFSSLHSCFVALPQVKSQHLTAPSKRRRLEWLHIVVGAPWLDEEAAVGDHSCKTRINELKTPARSASNSCQSWRIEGTFDPRVSQDVDRQPLDDRKDGCCLGPQAKGLRCRQWRFFRVEQKMADCIVSLTDTAQKHVIYHTT